MLLNVENEVYEIWVQTLKRVLIERLRYLNVREFQWMRELNASEMERDNCENVKTVPRRQASIIGRVRRTNSSGAYIQ